MRRLLRSLTRSRAVGLDAGTGAVKALALERRRGVLSVTGVGLARLAPSADGARLTEAIHAAMAAAGADGDPVVAAVGGPEVVIRQVSLPPLPPARILAALELQHRELGLLSPGQSVMDAQVLRKSTDGVSHDVLSVSAPRGLLEERQRLLEAASVRPEILDVEPLAILNGALHVTGLESGELLVVLHVGRETSVLCVFSERGPVVARYLEHGAQHFTEAIRIAFGVSPGSTEGFTQTVPSGDLPRARAACEPVVERFADDIRLSLAFYRTEFDRESVPRFALSGWGDLPPLGRWLAERLELPAPFESLDPFGAVEIKASRPGAEGPGPQFLQAFGLALRGV